MILPSMSCHASVSNGWMNFVYLERIELKHRVWLSAVPTTDRCKGSTDLEQRLACLNSLCQIVTCVLDLDRAPDKLWKVDRK
jgi:hypothetical protein